MNPMEADNFSWGAYAAELEHKLGLAADALDKEKRKNRYLRQEIKALQKKLWGFIKAARPRTVRMDEQLARDGATVTSAALSALGIRFERYGDAL